MFVIQTDPFTKSKRRERREIFYVFKSFGLKTNQVLLTIEYITGRGGFLYRH